LKPNLHSPIVKALKFVWKSAPGWTIGSTIVTFIQGLMPLVVIYMMKLLIDSITNTVNAPDPVHAFGDVIVIIIITGLAFLVNSVSQPLGTLFREHQSQLVTDYIYQLIHHKAVVTSFPFAQGFLKLPFIYNPGKS